MERSNTFQSGLARAAVQKSNQLFSVYRHKFLVPNWLFVVRRRVSCCWTGNPWWGKALNRQQDIIWITRVTHDLLLICNTLCAGGLCQHCLHFSLSFYILSQSVSSAKGKQTRISFGFLSTFSHTVSSSNGVSQTTFSLNCQIRNAF